MIRTLLRVAACALAPLAVLGAPAAQAQHYQADFPPEEFRARWNTVFDKIGDQSVAILQGGASTRGFEFPRQVNDFYYLSGIETAHAYLLLDGRTRKATLFLPPRNERLERAEGKVLNASDAALVRRLTGVDEVRSLDDMRQGWIEGLAGPGRRATLTIYTPFRAQEGYAQSRGEVEMANANAANDYWDGRIAREQQFVSLLRARAPRAEVRDLNPILDEMRSVKSQREIDLIRKASVLAGRGMIEAMRSTEPGVWEYQLDAAARYVFLVNGARLDAYRSIVGSGTDNINNMHYFRENRQMQAGELVLMDYAPDYRYYTSDIGRVWPVSGTYSPVQRQLLQTVLQLRNEALKRIRPGVTPAQILEELQAPMMRYIDSQRYSKPIYEAAAREMVRTGDGVFSHPVGLAVHDDGGYRDRPLLPGTVFSVDPTIRVPEENLYLRYEDVVVVTATGVENFTDFLPSELADMERLVRQKGIVQALPAQALP